MEPRASHIFIGGFVLLAAFSIVGFVVWLAKSHVETEVATYVIEFRESVTGLSVGADVRYSGIPVGKVQSIQLNTKDASLVDVKIEVDAKTPIGVGTQAELALQGITGVAFIQLKGGMRDGKKLQVPPGREFAVIPSTPSPIAQLFIDAPELMANLVALSRDLRGFLSDENKTSVRAILKNTEGLTATLNNEAGPAMKDLSKAARELSAMASPENRQALARILKNSDNLMAQINTQVDELLGGIITLLSDFHKLAGPENQKELTGILKSTRSLVTRVEKNGPEIETLIQEMSRTTVQLRDTITAVDQLAQQWDKVGGQTGKTLTQAQKMLTHADQIIVGDIRQTFASLRNSVERVNGLILQFDALATKNGEAVELFTSDGLIEMIRFLEDARRLVNNANKLITDLGTDPGKILFGTNRGGVKLKDTDNE